MRLWALGLTERWRHGTDPTAYLGLPLRDVCDPEQHEFYAMPYEDVIRQMQYSIITLKHRHPAVKIISLVSPVPLHVSFRPHLGPYVADQDSRPVLHATALRLMENFNGVCDMSSYAITRRDPSKKYERDGRHINETGIDEITKSSNIST